MCTHVQAAGVAMLCGEIQSGVQAYMRRHMTGSNNVMRCKVVPHGTQVVAFGGRVAMWNDAIQSNLAHVIA
jgi:hypothetical protein